ncbi:MAG: Ig-like domain repeat protein, partial [Janthinobacterium lividum]
QNVRMSAQQLAAGPPLTSSKGWASPQYTTANTSGTVHYLVPWDFRQIYGINTLINSGFDGTGVKIGVIGQSAVDTQQLTYFQGKTGQPTKMPTMVLVPNTGASNRVRGDEAESELDLEYASGSAPGAATQFIYTGCTATTASAPLSASTDCANDGVFTALSYAVTNNLAPILSLSYGGCESSLATYASTTLEPILKQANAQGQTVLVSSGDSGAAACDQTGGAVTVATHGLTTLYPSSSTYVTAVGGTQLNSDSSADWSGTNNGALGSAAGYMSETTWNDTSTFKFIEGSTGGISKIYQMPTWQHPYVQPGAYSRMVPDISFAASVAFHPYMVCLGDGACTSSAGAFAPGSDGTGVGGTSVAAPNLAAMLAVIEQANGGGALGNLNPALYALAAGSSASAVFHDIVTGNNIVPCKVATPDCLFSGSMGYSASIGYDLATGLGSISAPGLRAGLQSLPARTATLSLRVIPQRIDISSPQVGTPFSVVVDALGNSTTIPSGNVLIQVDSVAQPITQVLYNGEVIASISLNTLGPHTIIATYAGDANFDGAKASIMVTPIQLTPQIVASAFSSGATLKTPVQMQASVLTGTVVPTGTITFTIDGAAGSPPLSLNSQSVSFNYPGFQTAGTHTLVATYSGDALVNAVSSRSTNVVISAPSQTQSAKVTVTASMQQVAIGTPVTLTASVNSTSISNTTAPTGYITFNIDGKIPPTVALNAAGQASVTYTYTDSAFSDVSASYSGDNLYYSALGDVSVTVKGPPVPAIALALSTSAVTIPPTGTASVALNVSSLNGFTGPVSFAGAITSSSGAAYSGCYVVAPGVVNPSPGSPVNATYSMALASTGLCTKANVVRMSSNAFPTNWPMQVPVPWSAAGAVSLLGCTVMRRRSKRALISLLALAFVLNTGGCGGSGGTGSSSTTTTAPAPPTASSTAGTYVVRVTATAQTTGVSSSGTFTLTVQ